jgi:hypothetical protein
LESIFGIDESEKKKEIPAMDPAARTYITKTIFPKKKEIKKGIFYEKI